jgi:hypothetical protein
MPKQTIITPAVRRTPTILSVRSSDSGARVSLVNSNDAECRFTSSNVAFPAQTFPTGRSGTQSGQDITSFFGISEPHSPQQSIIIRITYNKINVTIIFFIIFIAVMTAQWLFIYDCRKIRHFTLGKKHFRHFLQTGLPPPTFEPDRMSLFLPAPMNGPVFRLYTDMPRIISPV